MLHLAGSFLLLANPSTDIPYATQSASLDRSHCLPRKNDARPPNANNLAPWAPPTFRNGNPTGVPPLHAGCRHACDVWLLSKQAGLSLLVSNAMHLEAEHTRTAQVHLARTTFARKTDVSTCKPLETPTQTQTANQRLSCRLLATIPATSVCIPMNVGLMFSCL